MGIAALLITGILAGPSSAGADIRPAFDLIVGNPPARTVKPVQAPAKTATLLPTSYATVFSAPMSPGDRLDWYVDFTQLLAGDTIETIEAITVSAGAAALGVSVRNEAGFAPTIDTENSILRFCVRCAPPPNSTAFNGAGIPAGFLIRLRTAGALERAYECTVAIMVVQL